MKPDRLIAAVKQSASYITHYTTTLSYSRGVNPGQTISAFIKRRKFEMRIFVFYAYHQETLQLFNDSKLRNILSENVRILDKVCRKYIIYKASSRLRFEILRSTYLFVRDNFSSGLIRSVFLKHDFPLCHIDLPLQQKSIVARLAYLSRFEKEGEMTLELFQKGERRLYSVTFSIHVQDGIPEVIIGCILGPDRVSGYEESDKQLVRDLTKEMHGERPKNLVVFLLQGLCRYFGIRRLLAVAFDSHIYGGSPSKRSRISTDYDEFWQELGGEKSGEWFYSLPLVQHRRTYDEIPSKKRASYARRYKLLDDLEQQMLCALHEINDK
jgi:uncharacterized protein VirK/YbjX